MILPIVAFGAPILREKCAEVTKDFTDLDILIENMWETMYAAHGVGLAAPQINKAIRLFIIDTSPFLEDEESDVQALKTVFINPVITLETGDEWEFNEGCLSIPEIREEVSRKPYISIRYYDEEFNQHIERFSDIPARIIQHEYDHMQGIDFRTRAGRISLDIAQRKVKRATRKMKKMAENKKMP